MQHTTAEKTFYNSRKYILMVSCLKFIMDKKIPVTTAGFEFRTSHMQCSLTDIANICYTCYLAGHKT